MFFESSFFYLTLLSLALSDPFFVIRPHFYFSNSPCVKLKFDKSHPIHEVLQVNVHVRPSFKFSGLFAILARHPWISLHENSQSFSCMNDHCSNAPFVKLKFDKSHSIHEVLQVNIRPSLKISGLFAILARHPLISLHENSQSFSCIEWPL